MLSGTPSRQHVVARARLVACLVGSRAGLCEQCRRVTASRIGIGRLIMIIAKQDAARAAGAASTLVDGRGPSVLGWLSKKTI